MKKDKNIKKFFSQYSRFLSVIFCVWLFLRTAKIFGFDFAVNLSFFFLAFLILCLPLLIWEIKKNWITICIILKNINFLVKKFFQAQAEEVQSLYQLQIKSTSKENSRLLMNLINIVCGIYIVLRIFLKKFVFNKKIIFFIFLIGFLFDIFILRFASDLLAVFLTILWIYSLRVYKFAEKKSITFALILLLICPFLVIINREIIVEKITNWVYIFLMIGIIQELLRFAKGNNQDENLFLRS